MIKPSILGVPLFLETPISMINKEILFGIPLIFWERGRTSFCVFWKPDHRMFTHCNAKFIAKFTIDHEHPRQWESSVNFGFNQSEIRKSHLPTKFRRKCHRTNLGAQNLWRHWASLTCPYKCHGRASPTNTPCKSKNSKKKKTCTFAIFFRHSQHLLTDNDFQFLQSKWIRICLFWITPLFFLKDWNWGQKQVSS